MLELSKAIRAYLEALHPVLPWAVLTLLVFVAVWTSRKAAPKLWLWFDEVTPDGMVSHVIQGLPAVLVGALASELLTGGDLAAAWKGALAGALAPVTHLLLKASPVPYQGAIRAVAKKAGLGTLVALVLLVTGCAGSLNQPKMVDGKLGATPNPTEYCRGLDAGHRTWGAFAKGSALLAGASGFATIPVDGATEEKALAYSSLGVAAAAATAVAISEGFASSHARDCR